MELSIKLEDPASRAALFGPADRHLKMIREAMGVQIFSRDDQIKLTGPAKAVSRAAAVIEQLQRTLRRSRDLTAAQVAEAVSAASAQARQQVLESLDVFAAGQLVKAKSPGQRRYIDAMQGHDMVFCTGPAGTGKTYLALSLIHI